MTKSITIILVLVVVIAGVYFGLLLNNNSNNTPSYVPASTSVRNSLPAVQTQILQPTSTAVSNTSSAPKISNVSVNIKNFAFNPGVINIKVGSKVTWTNNDSTSHTVTSDSGNILNSGTLLPGQSFSFTFTNSGSINYHCSIHPMMKGSIVISN